MTLYANDFSKAFSDLLERSGLSCYKLGQYTNLDEAYLSRLKNGQKDNPSPETVVKICIGFAHFSNKLTLHDFEKLFNSVGRSLFGNHKNSS